MFIGERAEDAAKEIVKAFNLDPGFLVRAAIAEIVQRAMDDDYDERMQDTEGS